MHLLGARQAEGTPIPACALLRERTGDATVLSTDGDAYRTLRTAHWYLCPGFHHSILAKLTFEQVTNSMERSSMHYLAQMHGRGRRSYEDLAVDQYHLCNS